MFDIAASIGFSSPRNAVTGIEPLVFIQRHWRGTPPAWADDKHRGFGGINASHSLGNCCASPLPRPSGRGRLQGQDGRGRGGGGGGAADFLQPPPPPPPLPHRRSVCNGCFCS